MYSPSGGEDRRSESSRSSSATLQSGGHLDYISPDLKVTLKKHTYFSANNLSAVAWSVTGGLQQGWQIPAMAYLLMVTFLFGGWLEASDVLFHLMDRNGHE